MLVACPPIFYREYSFGHKWKKIPDSKGAEGREYINLLFKVEDEIKDLPYEEKKQKRQDASQPILDAFWAWVEKTSAMYTTNEKLTQALGYCQNQRKYLETFLEDGCIPISNNYCEANIKPFATASASGCLPIPLVKHLQAEFYIRWWKVPEPMIWMSMST